MRVAINSGHRPIVPKPRDRSKSLPPFLLATLWPPRYAFIMTIQWFPGHMTKAKRLITTLLPKTTFAVAMQRGAKAKIDGAFVVDPAFEKAVTNARWEALYPQALLDEVPEDERPKLETYDAARQIYTSAVALGPQPLTIEGTTFASSQLYEHDDEKRAERMGAFIEAKQSLEDVSPNILRVFKTLDVCETGEHAFYNSVVEGKCQAPEETPGTSPGN